jgi:hypothetical protein
MNDSTTPASHVPAAEVDPATIDDRQWPYKYERGNPRAPISFFSPLSRNPNPPATL